MKCETYLDKCIAEYPSLYISPLGLHDSRLKVCDHLFNVIGNGIRDLNELKADIKSKKKKILPKDMNIFIEQDFFWGYFNDRMKSSNNIPTVTEEEKSKYPEVDYWLVCKKSPMGLYPNFKKQYSMVWKIPEFSTFGKDWIEWAITFYEACETWLQKNERKYHRSFPRENENRTNFELNEFRKYIAKYDGDYEAISKAYELAYFGDDYDFLSRRWQKEKERIFEFISETISMLEGKLKE